MKLSPSFPALRHCQRKAGERNKQRNSFSNLTYQKRERERERNDQIEGEPTSKY